MLEGRLDILDRWFDGYPPTEKAIDQLTGLLRRDGAASALVQAAMNEVALRRAAKLPPAPATRAVRFEPRRALVALAAAVVMVVLGAVIWHAVRPGDRGAGAVTAGAVLVGGNRTDRVPEAMAFDVPSGSPAEVRLGDGSLLKLDGASKAVVQLTAPQARVVRLLAGGADFDVSPQAREFRIETSVARVHVRGTRFRVALLPGALLQVVVRQGTVSVECGHGETSLTAGERRDFALLADGRGGPTVGGIIHSVDPKAGSIDITGTPKSTYRFGTVKVILKGQPTILDALKPGMPATLVLSPNEREVLEIRAADPR